MKRHNTYCTYNNIIGYMQERESSLMESMAFRNASFEIQIHSFTLCSILPNTSVVFQHGHVYCVPSLLKYRKITQTFGSVIISLPVK